MTYFRYFVAMIILSVESYAMTIVIDPGHGGTDLGAQGNFQGKIIYEKDVALQLAVALKNELSPYYQVYLTRDNDREVSLFDRAKIADQAGAHLFISIHANADESHRARGIETFYLDNSNHQAVKKIESVENKGVSGDDALINLILADLVVDKLAPQSKNLALKIHHQLTSSKVVKKNFPDRGVKPGIFYVLALTKRPAALLEAGFMTNEQDLKMLMDKNYHVSFAKSVRKAVDQYSNNYAPKERILVQF